MLIGTIDFPQQVINAQRDGRFVVFAGAGVSIPDPSNLPHFKKLADLIGVGCSPRKQHEPPDEYLGRLHKQGRGVPVHKLAAEILLKPESKPTELHRTLLRLFHPKTPVRIVTTNFDRHFSTAVAELGIELQTYSGPALPLGNDFDGLIYLHGAATVSARKIVLTDADFGRAYLTEAWASRFLYQMFLSYTVLFVGYSHDDVVMKYIAKGLPSNRGQRRFILTEKRDTHWAPYGIEPVYYDLRPAPNEHIASTESIQKWACEIHRGLHEKAEKIRSIVEAAPPLGGEDADYLHAALRDPDTAKQFRKFARLPEYIGWTEKHGYLKSLFQNERVLTEEEKELAEWFVNHCAPVHHEEALAVFQRCGPVLNSAICRHIAHVLTYRREDSGYEKVFCTWVTISLAQPGSLLQMREWEQLLKSCKWPQDQDVALLLLDRCFQPTLVLKEAWNVLAALEPSSEKKLVDYAIDIAEEHSYYLSGVWEEYFKPHLNELEGRLESIVTINLEKAHSLLRINRRWEGRYDPLGFRRRRIAESQSFGAPHALDVLIDAARDLMDHSSEKEADDAKRLIAKWIRSESPILNRMAIYGVAVSRSMASDEKIAWLLEKDLLFHRGAKAEVFDVVKGAFPSTTPDNRQRLFDWVDQKYRTLIVNEDADDTTPGDIFNLIAWIWDADPTCQIASSALASIKQKHPEFEGQRDPDVNFSVGGWRTMGDNVNLDNALAKPPSKWINAILAQSKSEKRDFDLDERIHAIKGAVVRQPAWGFDAQKYLVDQDIQEPAIWNQLFNGWREAKLTPPLWEQLIDALLELPDREPCADGIAEVLQAGSSRKEHALPRELMEKAFRLSLKAFAVLQKKKHFLEDKSKDWLGIAINRPGGKLALFWLEYLASLKENQSSEWTGLPEPVKVLFREVGQGHSDDSRLARLVLVSQLHYLFFLDREFGMEVFIPLLDWSRDTTCAAQCWQGFLGWGQWKTSFLQLILPLYQQTLPHLSEFAPLATDSFARDVATIAVFGSENPCTDRWLYRCVEALNTGLLREFAKTIREILEGMSPEASSDLWVRWLKKYWQDRIVNKPTPLDPQEVDQMVLWPIYLHSKFAEAVELLQQSPKFNLMMVDVKEDITTEYKTAFTNTAGEYINLLLGALHRHDHQVQEIRALFSELLKNGLSHQVAEKIRSSLVKLD